MTVQDRNALKSWFQRGLKPLAVQFADWIDSFWHKNESIPISSVGNLTNTLNNKANTEVVDNLDQRVSVLELSGVITSGSTYLGLLTQNTAPASYIDKVFYIADKTGSYPRFDGLIVTPIEGVYGNLSIGDKMCILTNTPEGRWIKSETGVSINNTVQMYVTKQGINGEVYPSVFQWPDNLKVKQVILMSNAGGIIIKIGENTYTDRNLVGVAVIAGTEVIIQDITIAAGNDSGNVLLIFENYDIV